MPIGNHIFKNGKKFQISIKENIELAEKYGVKNSCGQIFVIGPQNSHENLSESDKKELRKYIDELKKEGNEFSLFVHGSYLDNICGSKPAFALHLIKKELKNFKLQNRT